jgi:iodotyrosine deiodinase
LVSIKPYNMPDFIPFLPQPVTAEESLANAREFRKFMEQRRSLRMFSDRAVPREVIEELILAAGTAPSGAHRQPWTFCAISDPVIKRKIKEAAELEEYENYHGRMPDRWLQDLLPFGTDHHKPFLETAPWLIIVFKRAYEEIEGQRLNNYYVSESVGIATGMLLTAIHHAGLVALTHTPSPMDFLCKILGRPANERPFLLIPVGHPAEDAQVPDLKRKSLTEMSVFI